PAAPSEPRNDESYQDYLAGALNMTDYLKFTLAILANTDMAQLGQWRREFMRDCIEPMMLPKALELSAKHREAGDKLVVITATHRFVTAPIVAQLGIDTLLATECDMVDGRYTGRTTGVPCFREGKVTRLNRRLDDNAASLPCTHCCRDSCHDSPP
ncbi:HAD-IB family hydrolase, partial [Pseudomonas syringae]